MESIEFKLLTNVSSSPPNAKSILPFNRERCGHCCFSIFTWIMLLLSLSCLSYGSFRIAQSSRSNSTLIEELLHSYNETWTQYPYGSVNIGSTQNGAVVPTPYDLSRNGTNLTCNEYLHSANMIYDQEGFYYDVCDPLYPLCPEDVCDLIAKEDLVCQTLHLSLNLERCRGPSNQWKAFLSLTVLGFLATSTCLIVSAKSDQVQKRCTKGFGSWTTLLCIFASYPFLLWCCGGCLKCCSLWDCCERCPTNNIESCYLCGKTIQSCSFKSSLYGFCSE